MYWIDYTGIRRYRNTLRPGQMYLERSYASHPWLIRAIPTPKAEEQQVRQQPDKGSRLICDAGARGRRSATGGACEEVKELLTPVDRTCAQDKAKDGKRKNQQEGEASTPSNHALLIRLGPDAASSGQTFTSASLIAALHMPGVGSVSTSLTSACLLTVAAVWEPGRSNLSIMPFPRTDSGHYIPPSSAGGAAAHRPLHHSAGHLTEVCATERFKGTGGKAAADHGCPWVCMCPA